MQEANPIHSPSAIQGSPVDDIESQKLEAQAFRRQGSFHRQGSSREGKTKHVFMRHTSHLWLDPSEHYDGDHTQELRMGFIRKVYGILSAQLLLTVGVAALCMGPWHAFMLANSTAMFWGTFIPSIFVLFGLMRFKDAYPTNYVLLILFTLLEALVIGLVCALYKEAGLGQIIYEAAVITAGVFLGLTLFACQSKIDFTIYKGFLVAGLLSMIVWSLLSWIFGFSLGLIYSWLGAFLFCGFIVVDTQMIMKKYGYDDYIIGAIDLYLDIINLFLFILQILAGGNSSRD